ncbi:hypothetical protein ACLG6S_05310 [Thermodesulfobacteriota bacterium B35]
MKIFLCNPVVGLWSVFFLGCFLLFQQLLPSPVFAGQSYYVSNSGSDKNNGLTPATAWKTIKYINSQSFQPGSKILFKRGDTWRESLRPHSGGPEGFITYGAYGTGPKPLLLGSIDRSSPALWTTLGGNIWYTIVVAADVGNIIFNHGDQPCGWKKWNLSDLAAQGDYYYDVDDHIVYLYSIQNPGEIFNSIECALKKHIINESNRNYVIYDNLELKYGAAHGIGGGNTSHIIVRNCDISFIGGAFQYYHKQTGKPVRYGNGIEFWKNANDNLVENCKIWEIYDAAITNQSTDTCIQYAIIYRNNTIWNCEYSYEYWNRSADSNTSNIIFENNTCVNAGFGWSYDQRPDKRACHLYFGLTPAQTSKFIIRNNIFYQARDFAIFDNIGNRANDQISFDGNCWYQKSSPLIYIKSINGDKTLTMQQFHSRFDETGFTVKNSKLAKPNFVDYNNNDFRQQPDSPCLSTGRTQGKSDKLNKIRTFKMTF